MFKKIKNLQCRLRDRFPGQKPSCSIAQLDFDVWEDPTSVKTFAGQPDTKVRLPGQSSPQDSSSALTEQNANHLT